MEQKVGNYQIQHSLGKGGMGEVFLAYDPVCQRRVALKQIRKDLMRHKSMQNRFLREAHIASQLTHPSIIPIYTINQDENGIYYTMPYVEGETLKQILRATREQEKEGLVQHPIGSSIPTLIRFFLSVCQAIGYCHSKGFLHRDLKPENIIIGKYGEALILDWGLADFIQSPSSDKEVEEMEEIAQEQTDLTMPGKIVGTLAYMAPERALNEPSSILTDIYSLGVILYQILTLRLPFGRPSLASFLKTMKQEKWIAPSDAAPYRDIPDELSDIAKKCLAFEKEERYQNVEELIADIENYIKGKPKWLFAAHLQIDRKEDWEFQENVLLAKHVAITRGAPMMEWVSLMISKASFAGNTRVEAKVKLGAQGNGVGFLLSIPDASERKALEDGYCLWIGSRKNPSCRLFRSNIEVMNIPDVGLEENVWHHILIEKSDHHLRFYLNDTLKFHYLGHIPLYGKHVGLLYRDADFEMRDLTISTGSQNVMVNCLAIPDAFLASKNFSKALAEYRRIGSSFPGRVEGREALFRAGITLLEQGLTQKKKIERDRLSFMAHEEFGKLRGTPGAPLEYLGKSLVYKALGDIEEEIKCLELTIRKYPKHPLLGIVIEHIVFRLHETSYYDRLAAYQFALLSLRYLPQIFSNPDNQKLIESLKKHLEPISFIEAPSPLSPLPIQNIHIAIQLAFWLAKPISLVEIIETTESDILQTNALFCLLELGCHAWIQDLVNPKEIELALVCHKKGLKKALIACPLNEGRVLKYFFHLAIDEGKTKLALPFLDKITYPMDEERIWVCLLENEWEKAEKILHVYPAELLTQENHPFFFLYGCLQAHLKGKKAALKHFANITETLHPPLTALLGHFLLGKIDLKDLFHWEKVQLLRQLILFHHCAKEPAKCRHFKMLLKKELHRTCMRNNF